MAKRLSKEKERYLALRRELNPRLTQAESSHEPLSRDKSAELSNTVEHPARTKKPHCLLPNSMPYAPWDRSLIPLHPHHPLTSPFWHLPYHATRKSQPVLQPPMPESVKWPADWLCPSQRVPVDHRVQGLKLVTWELEYCLFQKVFESELSCCLLAHQEGLRRHLP